MSNGGLTLQAASYNVANIGNQNNPNPQNVNTNVQNQLTKKEAKTLFKNWWTGMGISLIPLLILPIWKLYFNASISDVLIDFFIDCEFLFIGVSLIITSINDFVLIDKSNSNAHNISGSIILLLFGAIVYGVLKIAEFEMIKTGEAQNIAFAIVLNVAFMLIIIVTGMFKYIKAIKE